MLALRWMEENIAKYRESKTPTAESIHAIDYSRRLELFETACKVFAIPMEVRRVCLHNSFCLNRESKVKSLSNQAKRLEEQRERMRSYEQLKAWEEIVISSDDEEALLEQITVSKISGSGTSRAKNTR